MFIPKPWLRFLVLPNGDDGGADPDGAGAGGGAGAPAPTPTPTPDPAPADPPADTTDWKAMARQWEDRSKANKAELDVLKAAQPAPKPDPTPEPKDTGPTPAETAALEQAATTARENLILRAAPALNADADALLDSSSFMKTIAKLDPAADDYGDKVKTAITKATTDNPRFATGPARAGKSGNPVGGSGPKTTPTSLDGAIAAHYQ